MRTACGERAAICSARCRASAATSASVTTRVHETVPATRWRRRASAPRAASHAAPAAARPGSGAAVRPVPSGSRAGDRHAEAARAPAMRMSQQAAISSPPPMHAPSICASSGRSQSSIACSAGGDDRARGSRAACSSSKRNPANSSMSPPEANCPPSPQTITASGATAAGSACSCANVARSSRHIATSIALSLAALASVHAGQRPASSRA